MTSKFTLGQMVKAISFTDCFGKFHAEVPNLIITRITLTQGTGISDYYRVVAEGIDSRYYQEGAERFFEPQAINRNLGASDKPEHSATVLP